MSARKKPGKVWIVGAGPGAPDLLTERARQAIGSANVILYDDLVHPATLPEPHPFRVYIPVGRRAGRSSRQESTERMMVRFARAGKKVVRLKGGDPFVFGRGGEEVETLRKAHVAYEVIPGVSSATGVPTLAGIPLTYRGVAASFAVVTGHVAEGKDDREPEWDLLAHSSDTLVIMMGMTAFPRIAARLIKAGKDPATPVAVIRWGSWPMERRWLGTLADGAAGRLPFGTPSAIVIGPVVKLARRHEATVPTPLAGVRVAVTRESEHNETLRAALAGNGALVSSCPAISTFWYDPTPAFRRAARNPGSYDWIVFTSANGVGSFCTLMNAVHVDARSFPHTRVAAIGRATATKLREIYDLQPDVVARDERAEGLLRALGNVRNKRFLLPQARITRGVLARGLRARGAAVTVLPVYETRVDRNGIRRLAQLLALGELDVVTFTSGSTVDFSMKALGAQGRRLFKKTVKAASIGPVTSSALRKWGIRPAIQARKASMEELAAAIVRYYRSHPHARPDR